jgi:hypothetical protein
VNIAPGINPSTHQLKKIVEEKNNLPTQTQITNDAIYTRSIFLILLTKNIKCGLGVGISSKGRKALLYL